MGRKSRVPDGWISLYGLAADNGAGRDTELAAHAADLAGIEVARVGPDRAASIREQDVEDWRWWLEWWRSRPKRPRRRKRRSDAGAAPRRRRRRRRIA